MSLNAIASYLRNLLLLHPPYFTNALFIIYLHSFFPQTGSSPEPQASPMAKAPQHTLTVSSAGIQFPVSIQLQSPGRMVQGAQGQLAILGSTVKQQQASRQQGDDQQEGVASDGFASD